MFAESKTNPEKGSRHMDSNLKIPLKIFFKSNFLSALVFSNVSVDHTVIKMISFGGVTGAKRSFETLLQK